MFEFFSNVFYLVLLGLVLAITYIATNNSWSREILSKQPNALLWNNLLILVGIVLITTSFFVFSWIAGITTIIMAFVLYALVARKISKTIEANLLTKR